MVKAALALLLVAAPARAEPSTWIGATVGPGVVYADSPIVIYAIGVDVNRTIVGRLSAGVELDVMHLESGYDPGGMPVDDHAGIGARARLVAHHPVWTWRGDKMDVSIGGELGVGAVAASGAYDAGTFEQLAGFRVTFAGSRNPEPGYATYGSHVAFRLNRLDRGYGWAVFASYDFGR